MKSKSLSLIVPETNADQIGEVLLAFVEMQRIHAQLKIFFQAAQGACLSKLRDDHGRSEGGRPKTSATCGGFVPWDDHVQSKYGFSADTAGRRIRQWKAMVPLFEKLPPADRQRIADFLRRPMLHLTPVEVKALEKVTHKIASLQDELDDLSDSPFIKQPRKLPHNSNPANNGSANAKTTVTVDEKVAKQLELFGQYTLSLDDTVDEGGTKILLISKWPKPRLDEAIKIAKRNLTLLVKVRGAIK